jgi:PKHD-type hydroxylase|tara:strand:+ start:2180 stop:2812 length:633 start_codon:yes stop_codon:yes gene_type:complete
MNLFNYYWYFKSALPIKFCDDVIQYGLQKEEAIATTGDFMDKKLNKKEVRNLKNTRNSDIVWLDETWIYNEILPYVHLANKQAGWNFQWERTEEAQFTKYKLNQHYDWHCDSWRSPYNKPNTPHHGKIRKLSMTCQLSDGSEYEGGELEFDARNYDPPMRDESKHVMKAKQILPKGSIVVFPSFVWHRVKPITKGSRYSLVVWNLGNPFK